MDIEPLRARIEDRHKRALDMVQYHLELAEEAKVKAQDDEALLTIIDAYRDWVLQGK